MRMQIFRVKKLSCKISKTKNCVPFEVKYTSSSAGVILSKGQSQLLCGLVEPTRGANLLCVVKDVCCFKVAPHLC